MKNRNDQSLYQYISYSKEVLKSFFVLDELKQFAEKLNECCFNNLCFSGTQRLEIEDRVELVLDDLGLQSCADTMVSCNVKDPFVNGIRSFFFSTSVFILVLKQLMEMSLLGFSSQVES